MSSLSPQAKSSSILQSIGSLSVSHLAIISSCDVAFLETMPKVSDFLKVYSDSIAAESRTMAVMPIHLHLPPEADSRSNSRSSHCHKSARYGLKEILQ